MSDSNNLDKTFFVEFWSWIFDKLNKITLFYLILLLFPNLRSKEFDRKVGKYTLIEIWVIVFTSLSVLCLYFSKSFNVTEPEKIFLFFGGWRVYEIVIYQINNVFFDRYRTIKKGKKYSLRGYLRIVLLSIQNFIEIIIWFAFFYRNIPGAFTGRINSFINSLYFSFYTMTTFGHSSIILNSDLTGKILTFFQSIIGLFMTLVVLSAFISLLPKPETLEESEQEGDACARITT